MRCKIAILLSVICSVSQLFGNEEGKGLTAMDLERLYKAPKILSVNKHEEFNLERKSRENSGGQSCLPSIHK